MGPASLAPWTLAVVFALAARADVRRDVELVRQRLIQHALSASAAAEAITGWVVALQPDGSWPDVDYSDLSPHNWIPAAHTNRIRQMAVAWARDDSPLHADPRLLAATLSALDFWLERDLICPNWWHNEIGVPLALSDALLILEDHLTASQREAGLRILARAGLRGTGQNLVWLAQITVARGALQRDPELVREAFSAIASEIRISEAEGIQADGSFHQHGPQLYSGGYGMAFAADCPLFARLAHGTSFQFSPDCIDVLSMYLLDGQQWLVRGRRFDYSAVGREITRPSAASAQRLIAACQDMLDLDPPRRPEFEAFLARLRSDPTAPNPPLVGNRCFWRSDLMSHHRPRYYASVRVTSSRLIQTELINGENTLGRHLADGVNYLYLDGDEYSGIFPVWDWQALPGTTCERTGDSTVRGFGIGEGPYAGGVSDGLYGVEAMDFARDGLSARKAWFFFDQEYVCLGAGITCPSEHEVVTTLNQCLLDGPVHAGTFGSAPAPAALSTLAAETWVHHDSVGYVFPVPTDVSLLAGARVGSWALIGPRWRGEVTADVFDLRVSHGASPSDASYSYIVVPGVTADETRAYVSAIPVEILANNPSLQACRHPGIGVTGFVFYEPAAVRFEGLPAIEVTRPCLLLWRDAGAQLSIAVSDPTHGTGLLDVRVDAPLSGDGVALSDDGRISTVRFELPEGPEAGRSVLRLLNVVG